MPSVSLICTQESFRPSASAQVQWLDWEPDYHLAEVSWLAERFPLTRADWEQNRAEGFRYSALVEQEKIAALAAVWTYSDTH